MPAVEPSAVTIRPASPADVPAIGRLGALLVKTHHDFDPQRFIAATRGTYVVTIDSDGQFDLADAFALVEELERGGYDGVTGWRMGKKDSAFRVLADRCMNLIVRMLFGTRLRDTNCAIKVVRGDVLRGLRIEARGYPTPTEICLRLEARGVRLGELGVTHRERAAGFSKLHPFRTAWSFLRFLFYLRMKLKLSRAGIIVEP